MPHVAAVSMVFPEDRLMAKMFNEEMAKFYEKYYENKGVTLIKGDTATGFEGNGKVESMFAVSTVLIVLHCMSIHAGISWVDGDFPFHFHRTSMFSLSQIQAQHRLKTSLLYDKCTLLTCCTPRAFIWPASSCPALIALAQQRHLVQSVSVHGLLVGVELKSGKKLEAGLVVVGVGAIPNTEMFKGQLDLLEDKPGGVKVSLRPCCADSLGHAQATLAD